MRETTGVLKGHIADGRGHSTDMRCCPVQQMTDPRRDVRFLQARLAGCIRRKDWTAAIIVGGQLSSAYDRIGR